MKIKFYNPKFKINSAITLWTQKEINYNYIYVFFFIISIILFTIFKEYMMFFYLFIIFIIIFITKKYNNKNLVKLENVEFEDRFNVYSEDDLYSRTILTPSFMYRIYDYVNKISKNRKYDFYFKDDYIYINYKIDNNYLEISFFKSLYVNLIDFVEFYQELKNISELASDLKLSFYDKNF
jgi:hypothetical protein